MKWVGRICLAGIISIGLIFCGCGQTAKVSNAKEEAEFTSNLRLLEKDLTERQTFIRNNSKYGSMWVYTDPDTKCEYLIFCKYDNLPLDGAELSAFSITPRYEMVNNQIRIKQKF